MRTVCRHVGYLGPPARLDHLLLAPRHSLLEQSHAPADMRAGGTMNADGFGVGWYPEHATSTAAAEPGDPIGPERYRNEAPMWTDVSLRALARGIRSSAVLAAARSATAGMPVTSTACAPFTDGRWLFSHNGVVRGWPDSLAKLAAQLEVTDLMTLEAPTDSAVLWALLRQRLAGQDPAEAVRSLVVDVLAASPTSRMNLLLTDGFLLVATTCGHALSVNHRAGSVALASEPFGDPGDWEPVPDRHLVVAEPERVRVSPLEPERPTKVT